MLQLIFCLLNNGFPLTNSTLLKVNIAMLWLEIPSKHYQSLDMLIIGDKNIHIVIL